MGVRVALTKHQRESIKTKQGAEVLVRGMNKEISMQKTEINKMRDNFVEAQDSLEKMRAKYHAADKKAGILTSKTEGLLIIEFLKFLVSGALSAYGFYLLDKDDNSGIAMIIMSIIFYGLLVGLQWIKKTK